MPEIRFMAAVLLLGSFTWSHSAAQKKDGTAAKEDGPLRLKVEKNVMVLVKKLALPERAELSAQVYFRPERWDSAVSSFRATREKEIQGHAHALVKGTMPTIMQQFMPKYMQAKIMAERMAKKAGGPPSAEEIEKIRANAMAKMQPEMQKTIMPALEKLTKERMDELLKDEKVLTRVTADQIMKGNFLPDSALGKFKDELDKAGYPAALTGGADAVLNERTKKMLQSIDIAAVAKKAGL